MWNCSIFLFILNWCIFLGEKEKSKKKTSFIILIGYARNLLQYCTHSVYCVLCTIQGTHSMNSENSLNARQKKTKLDFSFVVVAFFLLFAYFYVSSAFSTISVYFYRLYETVRTAHKHEKWNIGRVTRKDEENEKKKWKQSQRIRQLTLHTLKVFLCLL